MLGHLTIFSIISLVVLMVVYYFLISEKLPKALVAVLGGVTLILMQVFRSGEASSQENAFHFISHNLDILGFVIGMMILVGIVRESGVFEAVAIGLVKLVKGKPRMLLIALGYLTLFMTAFFSNIPTILILAPVVLVLIKQLNLPPLPFLFIVVTMANLGGAMTPISDPTTYYQAKTVGLSFSEVVSNSGVIVLVLSVVSTLYVLLAFNKDLNSAKVNPKDVALFDPKKAIQDKYILRVGLPIALVSILVMVFKEKIYTATGISLDNATVTIAASFLSILIFHKKPRQVFRNLIDWEIIFFFIGLFVVVGALEFTNLISLLAKSLVDVTGGNLKMLLGLVTIGSGFISTFIDNVPYNITMVSAIQEMQRSGIWVYPLWWALNLGTSIGGAGSPIAAACNVIVFGQAEKEKIHVNFLKYLMVALPLVLINGLVTFGIIWLKFLR
ncbi:TRAP transporter large permease subunit [Patescibacteria group bacterium]|nr:TRAP transporter large permease subunit [Patescibacteria group bacterium]